jgi:hypothetical protein
VQNSPEVIQKPLTNRGQKELKKATKRDLHHWSILTKSGMEARGPIFRGKEVIE